MDSKRNQRIWMLILLAIAFCFLSLPAYTQYSGGSGTAEDPYQIATAEDLISLGEEPNDYDKYFKLMADIDLSGYTFDRAVIAPDTNDAVSWYEGISFTGVFDGNDHTISHLTITGLDYLGLFGNSGGTISNLGLEAVDVNGTGYYVGGLVGDNNGSIVASYSTGTISGSRFVGALVGSNSGNIMMSYSTGSVSSNSSVGGLVGGNANPGHITLSYSNASVNGFDRVGGLVGWTEGFINSCYSTGSVSGSELVGGLVGHNDGVTMLTPSFWDMETSGQTNSGGGKGLTTLEMQDINTYLSEGWDFVGEILNGTCDYWQISPDEYPRLRWQDSEIQMPEGLGTAEQPYRIRDVNDLGTVWFKPLACYRLEESIDLSGIMWSTTMVPWFDGIFEGDGHVISNLHHSGLFGQLGPRANISNLGVESIDIVTDYLIVAGGLAEQNNGSITNCYSTGTVSGDSHVGGLVGRNNRDGNITVCYSTAMVIADSHVWVGCGGLVGLNEGIITNCYSTGSVSGNGRVGGLVGENIGGIITTCYSTGSVMGNNGVGGLVGDNYYGSITTSVWDVETSGLTTSDGGLGLTTAEMMDPYMLGLNGFANDPNWVLDAGRDYPRLAWEGTTGQIIPNPIIDWLDGQGTEEEPYCIYLADQLILLRRASGLWDMHFALGADIDLDPNLPGRRVFSQAVFQVFSGVFDGKHHTISNLTITGDKCLGLFGQLSPGAIISNLVLRTADVNGTGRNVGALVGCNAGIITACYSTGTVNGDYLVGGLVGYNNEGSISSSCSTGTVNGNGGHIGGLVGDSHYGSIRSSYSTGTVAGTSDVGGLVGSNSGSITTSYSTGTVAGTSDDVGGLVGGNSGAITMSYSTASVNGDDGVGGLVGENSGSIMSSYSAGVVSGINRDVGGLAGVNGGSITTSYSTGSVSGYRVVGGLVGYNRRGGNITQSYSTGSVNGDRSVGGLVGGNGGSITSSFWDMETSGRTWSTGGIGKTTAEMQLESTFTDAGWDFLGETDNGIEDIWSICEGTNYPRFVWQIPAGDFLCPDGIMMDDFDFFIDHYEDTNCDQSNGYCDGTDLDFSGTVDIDDFLILFDYWLKENP